VSGSKFIHFILFLFISTTAAAELTEAQRERLWEEVEAQHKKSDLVIYENGRGMPNYPGFVMSNELTFWTSAAPQGGGDLQVGAGTVINFNLAVVRKSKSLVMVHQSPEVVAMNMSFYRPLFLAAETPAEFLAFVGGLVPKRGETTDEVFERVLKGEPGTQQGLDILDARLAKLATAHKISAVDRKFAMAVANDQVFPPSGAGEVPVFRKARHAENLLGTLGSLYSPKIREHNLTGILKSAQDHYSIVPRGYRVLGVPHPDQVRNQIREEVAAVKVNTFLSEEGFKHVRGLFDKKEVHFAHSAIEDPKLWKAIGKKAKETNRKVTDFYISNIPSVQPDSGARLRSQVLLLAAEVPHGKVIWHEAPASPAGPFATSELDIEIRPPGPGEELIDGRPFVTVCAQVLRAAPFVD